MSPSSRWKLVVATLSAVILAATPELPRADLTHGFVNLVNGGFDFSTRTQYAGGVDYIDVAWCVVLDPPLGDRLCMWNGSGILAVPDSAVEDITHAPPESTLYSPDANPVPGQAYVVRTGDGFYAKFAVREFIKTADAHSLLIEYFVQMDGTNHLDDDIIVAVQQTTWGRVKALYAK
jgi:hypothetical protein